MPEVVFLTLLLTNEKFHLPNLIRAEDDNDGNTVIQIRTGLLCTIWILELF